MKTQEKKQLIAQLIEKYVQSGYDITEFIGRPLSYFDEEKIKVLLENKHFFKNYIKWRTNSSKCRALNRVNTN